MSETTYLELFKHEFWANLSILENYFQHPKPPKRASELISHIIASQRIWLDRLKGKEMIVKPFELFEDKFLLELLEINFEELIKTVKISDYGQLISYKNTSGKQFVKPIGKILTHLILHSTYHRGQLVLLLKQEGLPSPNTDFIYYD